MKITEFNKTNLKTLRADIDAALAKVAADHGIDLQLGKISFDATSFSAPLKATVADLPLEKTKAGAQFLLYCKEYGFAKTDLGREFEYAGGTMRLIGFNLSNPKNMVMLSKVGTDKTYRAAEKAIWSAMHPGQVKSH